MTEFTTIRYEERNGMAHVVLARPDKRNALNRAMFSELATATERAASDDQVRAVLVQGDGPSFCAGIDLSLLAELAANAGVGDEFDTFVAGAQRPFLALATMPKPTLAAVQGHALGAGFQLALACDLRLAADDARFGMLEARYGLIPDLGGPHRLARLVGTAVAKELIWSTRTVDAEEALRIGLVNRVAPAAELADAAESMAREVTLSSPFAVSLAKELVDGSAEVSLGHHLARAAAAQKASLASEDHREAVAAFLERRKPRYTGR